MPGSSNNSSSRPNSTTSVAPEGDCSKRLQKATCSSSLSEAAVTGFLFLSLLALTHYFSYGDEYGLRAQKDPKWILVVELCSLVVSALGAKTGAVALGCVTGSAFRVAGCIGRCKDDGFGLTEGLLPEESPGPGQV